MKFEMGSSSGAEKKRDRAAKIRANREAIKRARSIEASLSGLISTYKRKYPDDFKRRYPHGVADINRQDKNTIIARLEHELDELNQRARTQKTRDEGKNIYMADGKVEEETYDRPKRKTGAYDPEAELNKKHDPTGEKAVMLVDRTLRQNRGGIAVLGDVFKAAVRTGVSYLTGGDPYLGSIAAEGLEALWKSRKNIAEGWRKMKSWFGNLRNKKLNRETVADNIDKLANLPIKGVPEVEKTYYNFGLRRAIVDLLRSNSEVARLLFENPTKENLLGLLQKYNASDLPPGTAEACQNLLNKDTEIRDILKTVGRQSSALVDATAKFKDAMDRGDLVSANGALVPVSLSDQMIVETVPENAVTSSGPVSIQGYTDEMIANTELYKKLYEEYLKSRNAAEENSLAVTQLQKERLAMTTAFNNKLAEEIRRHIAETSAQYEERLKEKQAALDAKTAEFNQATESLALVEAGKKNAEADRDGFEKQFREVTAKNARLTSDLQAIAAKGEQQFTMIEGLKTSLESYKRNAAELQALADDYDNQLKELTKQKEGQLVELRENNQLVIVEKDKRIDALNRQIRDLEAQVETQKELVSQGQKLLNDKAAEIIALQAKGDADSQALVVSYGEERKKITAERDRLQASNEDLNKQIWELKKESSALITESVNYKTQIEQLQAQVDAGHELQSKLENVNAGFKNKISSLETTIDKQQKDNDVLQEQVANLMSADAENKEALIKKSREILNLKLEKEEVAKAAALKYQGMEAGYAKELKEANEKIEQLSAQQEQYKKELENEKWWWSIFQDKDKIKTLEENIVNVEQQKVAEGLTADIARANLWKAMRGDYASMTKRVAGSTGGAYLVGSAPDWNLQPNERIQQFWSKFYSLTFHPY